MVGDRMRATCADDMSKMGLEVVSFTIKEVRDKNEYITNMGRPDIARIKRDADVAAAEAERDTAIKRAVATREAAVAKAQADQERVLAETLSQAKQAESQRDLEIKKAQYVELSSGSRRRPTRPTTSRRTSCSSRWSRKPSRSGRWRKSRRFKVQEAEIVRHEKELIATVLKSAEMERQRIETLAEAEKRKPMVEAEGRATATRAARRSGSRDHLEERRGGSQGDEREGGGVPGMEPGRCGGQADHRSAGDRAKALAAPLRISTKSPSFRRATAAPRE